MSGLQGLQTTDWERRNLAMFADATAYLDPGAARVIRELLSDYDVLRAETANLTAENERLRDAATAVDEAWSADDDHYIRADMDAAMGLLCAALAATAPTAGEEPAR